VGLISLVLLPTQAIAQYRFDNWTADEGLPQNSVSAILQTRDGYLWLTTAAGLVRFDGLRFTVFDKSNTKGLTSVRFSSLFEDEEGSLWIGTEDGGLTRYHTGVFATYTTQDGLPHNRILAIWGEERGGLLILTASGLVRWQHDQFLPYQAAAGISINQFCYRVRSGAFWCSDTAGLHRIKDDQISTYTIRDGLSSLNVSTVYEDRQGNVWIGTANAGLNRLQQGRFTHFTTKDGLPKEPIRSIYQDRQGNLWLATQGGALCQLQNGRFVTYATTDPLIGNIIPPFYEDREGNLWLGSADHGLRRLRKEVIAFHSVDGQLSQTKPYPLLEDHAGDMWIGTLGGGLYRYKEGTFTHYPSPGGSYRTVSALFEDRDGRLWIGGTSALSSFKNGRFVENKSRFGLTSELVRVILQDRAGRYWVGTDHGLIKYENERAAVYTAKDGLADDDVIALLEDHTGRVWIGTRGGLSRFQDGEFVSFNEQNGLPSNHVRALYEDADGTLWIGTYDGGLGRLRDGRFTRYTVAQGLFNSGVFAILEDTRGNLWMSCNRGIYSVSKQQLNDFAAGKIPAITSVAYGKPDGLLNSECNGNRQPAGWHARDGRLWFPTQGGVAVVDPAAISSNPYPPPVVIEEALLDGKAISPQAVQINPGQENLEIGYTALSFIKPENVRFKYKLAGVDKDWVEAGARRRAYYAHLPPGAYTFKVIAANSDGVWNNDGASLSLIVRPPFWRTWWFLTLMILFVTGIAILVHERRLVRLRRAHAAQESFSRQLIESQEQHRKKVAGELHDSLGQSLAIIKSRAALSLSQPEDHEKVIEQMEEISAAAVHAIEEVREIAYNLRPYQLDRLGLTRALETMLKKTVDSNVIKLKLEIDEIDGIFEKESEINLYRIVQESVSNILKHADATEARVAIKKDEREIEISIQDNGKGFNPEAASLREAGRGGFGLFGIAERVRMMRGQHVVDSAPGSGTTVTIKFDLKIKPERTNGGGN
jgi:ligand-binding sensor domain-containing protein/signal transduction histidine kinase